MIRFISGKLNTKINNNVIQSFKKLSKDNYLKSAHCYRFRAFFSELNLIKNEIYIKKNNNFFQKKKLTILLVMFPENLNLFRKI